MCILFTYTYIIQLLAYLVIIVELLYTFSHVWFTCVAFLLDEFGTPNLYNKRLLTHSLCGKFTEKEVKDFPF